jgi:predicted nuclease of predicted toxin-antitoxin system
MIIADENIPLTIIESLKENKIDTISIFSDYRGISDIEIIELAQNPPKTILTEDKDFGDLIFAYNQKQVSVVLLRYHYSELDLITSILIKFLQNHQIENHSFIVITTKSIRIRKL